MYHRIINLLDDRLPRLAVALRVMKYRWAATPEVRAIDEFVHEGDYALDIGARRGLFTSILADKVGPGGRVDAFEPFPPNMATLRQVFGNRSNVRLIELALSSAEAERDLVVPVEHGVPLTAYGSLEAHVSGSQLLRTKVMCRPLDRVLADRDRPIAFIKCDVEGHELEVAKGAEAVLTRDRPVVLMEIEQRHISEPFATRFNFMAGLGYDTFFMKDGGWRSFDTFDLARDQDLSALGSNRYINLFLFRPRVAKGRANGASSS